MSLANDLPLFRKRMAPFVNPLPEENTLSDEFEFEQRTKRQGGTYTFPIQVSQEQGITLATDGGTNTTNASIDAVTKEAQIDGSEIIAVSDMSSSELARSSNGADKNSQDAPAYFEVAEFKMKQNGLLGQRVIEVQLAWGAGTGAAVAADIGVVSSSISGANLGANQVVCLTRASWIPGLWPLMQNALVDIYQADGTTQREINVQVVTLTSVTQNRIQLFKAASANTVAATDRIVLVNAKTKSCYGIQAIGENVGTMFNIDALANIVWRVTQFTSFGAPTRAKIGLLAARLSAYGVKKGGTLFTATTMLADLIEEADLTHHFETTGGSDAPRVKRQGSSAMVFTTTAGDIKVVAHSYWKQGFAFFHGNRMDGSGKIGKRIGATEWTYDESKGGMMFRALESATGARIRGYAHMAPILTVPWHCAWISGVTSNADTLPS